MKATKTVPADMLDNENETIFKNDFFKRFKLRHAPAPLQLTDKIEKDYKFPTFYGNVTCAMGIFMCSYKKAAKLVAEKLNPSVKPVRMTRGRSIIAFSCYEYKNVMGVAPYNEIAMAIPVMVNAQFSPPLLPMIMNTFDHFGYYIAGMPVTSYENQLRGNKIWGLPKVTQDIDIKTEGNECITAAYEESGEPYLTLMLPTNGKPVHFNTTSNLYSRLDGRLLQSETSFKATFNVTKNMKLLFKKYPEAEKEYLKIGNTTSAKMLKELEIEAVPFQCRYAEGMSSCFDLPRRKVQKWFEQIR